MLRNSHLLVVAAVMLATPLVAQENNNPLGPPDPLLPGLQKSSNMKLVGHVPLGSWLSVADVEVEQELTRPFAYVARRLTPAGFDIIDLRDLNKIKRLYHWDIENAELHQGAGGLNPMYFKHKGRYYLTVSFQFQQGGPDTDLGAIVWDVTGLPDVKTIKEVGRIRMPDNPGGFHESFTYKHSNGTPMLFTTASGAPFANVFDMDKFLRGEPALIGRVPVPEGASPTGNRGYHDFYLGYDPQTKTDRFYGAGAGGFYVYDVSDVAAPKLITSVVGVAGMSGGHTFTPDPLGRFAILESEYQYAPLRFIDLKPNGQQATTVNRPIGAWAANWKNLAHNHEVRWPYAFISAYEDGLGVVNMMDPTNPITVGYYDTYEGPHAKGACGGQICNGAFGVDVRNTDGLIVISDLSTGFWAFKMEGFDGWNGKDWGMPNISSAQDWDNGPEGAPRAPRPVTLR
jgi:hypothetical protein